MYGENFSCLRRAACPSLDCLLDRERVLRYALSPEENNELKFTFTFHSLEVLYEHDDMGCEATPRTMSQSPFLHPERLPFYKNVTKLSSAFSLWTPLNIDLDSVFLLLISLFLPAYFPVRVYIEGEGQSL